MNEDLKRLQFLEQQESAVNSMITSLSFSADRIASRFTATAGQMNEDDIIEALNNMFDYIEEEEKPKTYQELLTLISLMVGLGVGHVTQELITKGVDVSPLIGISSRIAEDLITNPFDGDVSLADSIWSNDDKIAITKAVEEGIKVNETAFQVAERISKTIKTGRPRYTIDRIANTELVRAYSKANVDVLKEAKRIDDRVETYVEISLSPMHPRYDICDALVGRYKLEDAPVPPHHPNCICGAKYLLFVNGKKLSTTSLSEQIRDSLDILNKNNIDITTARRYLNLVD